MFARRTQSEPGLITPGKKQRPTLPPANSTLKRNKTISEMVDRLSIEYPVNSPLKGISPEMIEKSGMLAEHIKVFLEINELLSRVSIFRDINRRARSKLMMTLPGGARVYSGKVMSTKDKSSEFWAIAAEIPVDISLSKQSKSFLKDAAKIYREQLKLMYELVSPDLFLSQDDINKLTPDEKEKRKKEIGKVVEDIGKQMEFEKELRESYQKMLEVKAELTKIAIKDDDKLCDEIVLDYQAMLASKEITLEQYNDSLMFTLNRALLHKIAPKIVQIDGKSYELMVLKTINRDGSLETVYSLGDNEPQPFFVIKVDGVYCACIASISANGETLYFKGSEINIKKTLKGEPLQKVEPVEVISYRRFKLNEDRTEVVEDTPSLVAPDYDELVSEVATIFPYTDPANAGKEYTVQVSYDILKQAGIDLSILGKNFEMFKAYNAQDGAKEGWGSGFCNIVVKFGGDGRALEDGNGNKLLTSINVNGDEYHLKEGFDSEKVRDFVENIFLADKLRKEDEVLNAECLDPMMGVTTKTKNSQIAYINAYLGQNVFSHADESSNKNPEPFVRGNYTVILPNNELEILEDDEQICEFISQKRRDGYPLQINPFWFWLRDEGGNLFIPPEDKQFSFDDFSKARKDASQKDTDHPDRKIYECFIELLHLETAPPLHFVADSNEEFKDMKDRIYNKYEQYREAQIKLLTEEMQLLSGQSIDQDAFGKQSPMVKVFYQYKGWAEVQKREHVPNPEIKLLSLTARRLSFEDLQQSQQAVGQ